LGAFGFLVRFGTFRWVEEAAEEEGEVHFKYECRWVLGQRAVNEEVREEDVLYGFAGLIVASRLDRRMNCWNGYWTSLREVEN
jgi:hypothetical protein